jgi:hypothetical protein
MQRNNSDKQRNKTAISKGIAICNGTIEISQAAVDHRYGNKQLDDIYSDSEKLSFAINRFLPINKADTDSQ